MIRSLMPASLNVLTIMHFIFKKNKIVNFGIFFWWWSLQRGQLNKSPCVCQKKRYKIRRKKTPQFHKTWPTELSFDTSNLYKKDTLGLLFLWRFVENWAIPEFICEKTFWRFTEDVYKILCYKIQKNSPFL